VVDERPPLRALAVRRRFWNAQREERAWRMSRWGTLVLVLAVLAVTAFLVRDVWFVQALLTGRELRLAQVCADSPFAAEHVTRAGGVAASRADPDVFAPYLADVAATDEASDAIRNHASLVGDDDLSVAAATVLLARPHRAPAQAMIVEQRCTDRMREVGLEPVAPGAP
jgi:hypothetical protein